MPSYATLTVLALAASTVSPALSAPVPVNRKQAPNYSELVSGKRGLFGGGAAKVGEEKLADGAAKKGGGWGKKAKNLLMGLVVGGVAASAGTDIYGTINPNSKALGGTGEPASTDTSGNTGDPTTDPSGNTGYPSTVPTPNTGYNSPDATEGPYYTDTNPSDSGYTTGPGYTSGSYSGAQGNTAPSMTGAQTGPGYTSGSYSGAQGNTAPSMTGTQTTATRAIAERASEEHALDSKSPVEISTNSNLNSRTSPPTNLLSRADLEKAIGLFSRMLDELD